MEKETNFRTRVDVLDVNRTKQSLGQVKVLEGKLLTQLKAVKVKRKALIKIIELLEKGEKE